MQGVDGVEAAQPFKLLHGDSHEVEVPGAMPFQGLLWGNPTAIVEFLVIVEPNLLRRRLGYEEARIEAPGPAQGRDPSVVEMHPVAGEG